MFGLFKKEVVKQEENTELISVSNLKQHVVDAYEKEKFQRSKIEQLTNEVDELSTELKKAEIEKVVLSEKERELKRLKQDYLSLESNLKTAREDRDEVRSQLNSYRIEYRDMEKEIERINKGHEDEIRDLKEAQRNQLVICKDKERLKQKGNLIKIVEEHKGNLSKQMMLDYLNEN